MSLVTYICPPWSLYLQHQPLSELSQRCAGDSENVYLVYSFVIFSQWDILLKSQFFKQFISHTNLIQQCSDGMHLYLSKGVSDLFQLFKPFLISLRFALLRVQSPSAILIRQVDQVHLKFSFWSESKKISLIRYFKRISVIFTSWTLFFLASFVFFAWKLAHSNLTLLTTKMLHMMDIYIEIVQSTT